MRSASIRGIYEIDEGSARRMGNRADDCDLRDIGWRGRYNCLRSSIDTTTANMEEAHVVKGYEKQLKTLMQRLDESTAGIASGHLTGRNEDTHASYLASIQRYLETPSLQKVCRIAQQKLRSSTSSTTN